MRGLERWLMDTIENQAFCEALLDKTLKFWIDYHTGFLGEVGDIVDVVMIGDDLAGQSGPLFSPDFYRNIVKPRQKKLIQHIKSLTKAKIWYHTCGACFEYIPELIDNGIDILNPVQIGLMNMEPEKLKNKFGTQITLWGGGIDAQHVLAFAKPAPPQKVPSDINSIVRRISEHFNVPEEVGKRISLHTDLGAPPEIAVDENQIYQALLNLVNNSVQAIVQDGDICIR